MVNLIPWGSQAITGATLGTEITIDKIPDQYPIKRILVTIYGTLNITAGGTTDYTSTELMIARMIRNIKFNIGSSNQLKAVTGFQAVLQQGTFFPNGNTYVGPVSGTAMGVGYSTTFACTFPICFSDYNENVLRQDFTMLQPSLYEDVTMTLEFDDLATIASGGDRPFNIAGGLLDVTIEQETAAKVQPTTLLREYYTTTPILATGALEIDLPTSDLITRIGVCFLDGDDLVSIYPPMDVDQVVTISLNNGQVNPIQSSPTNLLALNSIDMSVFYPVSAPVLLPINLDPNHNGEQIIDNRTLSKWTLNMDVVTAVGRVMYIHYYGRNEGVG